MKEIKAYITELTDILRHEIKSFNIIVELLILEEKSLLECDNKLLMHVLERQGDVFSSIACLEKSRMEIVEKIGNIIGKDPDKITISFLEKLVDGDDKKELQETAHILSKINDDIKQKKITNNMLIKQGMLLVESNIRFLLKAIGRDDLVKDIYSQNALRRNYSVSVRLDGRV